MKKRIRKRILKKRSAISEKEWEEKSFKIQKEILQSCFYNDSESLLLYYPFDREVKTDLIIEDALERGRIVCLPCNDWSTSTFVASRIYAKSDIDTTKKIPEPSAVNPFQPDKIELVIVPGVVFDASGNRIGMGGGFFDRFLKECRRNVITVAPAFDLQLNDELLPVDPWDKKVDMIITETRIIVCRNHGQEPE